ncbi:MAG TPA: ACT domain-containing protein [Sedimentisphaerales bacterium]|nr:ACT domain-containing protein [Sedimentisphaerales bacterium]HRS11015.1 ACT domain-containing protein [Sedimentisphaerales bacterium]HRV49269.1 ACT domain-containing protein [Sedimentisphaerales bacterium]
MAKQLTIFVENRAGRLKTITQNLHRSNIDIRAFTIQDRGDYGLLRLIVDRPHDAYLALAELGCACALKDILAISVPDQPGNFHRLTSALAEHNINVIDAYGFVLQPHKTGICCMEIDQPQLMKAQEIVAAAGFTVLQDEELCSL